jgi:hypothetical protein
MLGPAVTKIRAHFEANFGMALPVRWPNEAWENGESPQAEGRPFIEAEIVGGRNRLEGFGVPGQRVFVHPGIIRFFILAPISSGMDDALATADVIAGFMERTEFGRNGAGTEVVRTFDFSTYNGTAAVEDGSFVVLESVVPFEWWYQH